MFSVLGKLGWFFKEHWVRYTTAISLLILVGIMEILPPKLIGIAIDEMNSGRWTGGRMAELVVLASVLVVVIYGLTYIWMYQLFGGAFLAERSLRSRLLKHLLNMSPVFYERNRTGDLMARATNDLKAVSNTAGFGILTLIDSTLFLLTIVVVMAFFISWKLTLAAMIPLPLIAIAIQYFGKAIHKRFTAAQRSFGELNDSVLETISGIRVLRAYVQERAAEQRFFDMSESVYRKNVDVAKIDAVFEPIIKILFGASYLIGIGYGAYLVFHQEITLGELVSFNVYLGMLIWPMIAIGELINIMQRGNASLDRVQETLAQQPEVTDPEQPIRMAIPQSISFDRVSFRYPSSRIDNLKNVSFRLIRGQTLGVVGKTGSGKTTLLRQLLREYPLDRGTIRINDTPLEKLSPDLMRSWLGYVPQEHILFSKTVEQNILFGAPERDEEGKIGSDGREAVRRAAETAALTKDIPNLPQGYQTLVGEKGVALSGGQKQRVSIARAMIAEAEILLLDDALSAVDGKTEAEIIGRLRKDRQDKTTVIATHRLTAVQHADRILVLDGGAVVEEGNHDQLMALGGWYAEQYTQQQMEAKLSESGDQP